MLITSARLEPPSMAWGLNCEFVMMISNLAVSKVQLIAPQIADPDPLSADYWQYLTLKTDSSALRAVAQWFC
ncbi:hypothetical protein [Pseudomonas rhizosphaerae]|uniref:hypothetical protein n=1 Tax=Pseudomonas rhizosphaerae TaxID=216142 RepID=UPI002B4A6BF1|nr:hypothetical protein [Pseudomonas rhizosphaerae]MEB2869489.1 hypothetical protein [Pseudomonas rhizosphaerae]